MPNDDAASLGHGCSSAELVFLLGLAFADAGHARFVESVDIACARTLLKLHGITKVQGPLMDALRFRRKLAIQVAAQDAGNGPEKRLDFTLDVTLELDVSQFGHGGETHNNFGLDFDIRGKGKVLILHAGVHDDLSFFGLVSVEVFGDLEDLANSILSDEAAEIGQL